MQLILPIQKIQDTLSTGSHSPGWLDSHTVNLHIARLRRNLTIEDVAEKIGTGRRAVMDAEKGKGSASAAVYIALLWVYDLLGQMSEVADPAFDEEGLSLSLTKDRARARAKKGLDNDF